MHACSSRRGGNQRQSEAIRGHQRQSEAIRGVHARLLLAQRRQSEAIRGHQRQSEARLLLAQTQDLDDQRRIRLARPRHEGPVEALAHLMREAIQHNQRQSAPISGPREAPAHHDEGGHHAIRGNQRQSAAISGNQRSERGSRALSGLGGTSSRAGRRACRGRASRGPPRPSRPPRPPAPRARPRARVRTEEAP